MLATAVIEVAARLCRQGMHEQHAFGSTPWQDEAFDRLEVLARVLLAPGRAAFRERLQPQGRATRVTRHAARMARTFGDEDRLDLGLEVIVVERRVSRL